MLMSSSSYSAPPIMRLNNATTTTTVTTAPRTSTSSNGPNIASNRLNKGVSTRSSHDGHPVINRPTRPLSAGHSTKSGPSSKPLSTEISTKIGPRAVSASRVASTSRSTSLTLTSSNQTTIGMPTKVSTEKIRLSTETTSSISNLGLSRGRVRSTSPTPTSTVTGQCKPQKQPFQPRPQPPPRQPLQKQSQQLPKRSSLQPQTQPQLQPQPSQSQPSLNDAAIAPAAPAAVAAVADVTSAVTVPVVSNGDSGDGNSINNVATIPLRKSQQWVIPSSTAHDTSLTTFDLLHGTGPDSTTPTRTTPSAMSIRDQKHAEEDQRRAVALEGEYSIQNNTTPHHTTHDTHVIHPLILTYLPIYPLHTHVLSSWHYCLLFLFDTSYR